MRGGSVFEHRHVRSVLSLQLFSEAKMEDNRVVISVVVVDVVVSGTGVGS